MNNTGYLNPLYARSLSEFGTPVELPESKGWILKRDIPGAPLQDGMGPYPIFSCRNWVGLANDLADLEHELVSLSLVTDPFGEYTQEELQHSFPDITRPYKEHFVVDLNQDPKDYVSKHHQRNLRKAQRNTKVEINADDPIQYLDEWCQLYDNLIQRHNIKGITKFSRDAFKSQLKTPGMVVFRAIADGVTLGMLLWYKHGDIGYYHLGAYSVLGYEKKASFALFGTLIEYFADTGLNWLSLGAGAGVDGNGNDGLTRFKRGWSTGTRTAYFCGRIFNKQKYNQLVDVKNSSKTDFFPAYRVGEFRT